MQNKTRTKISILLNLTRNVFMLLVLFLYLHCINKNIMKYILNGMPITPVDSYSDGVWFEWRNAFFHYVSDNCGVFDCKELKKISPCNIRCNGIRGRNRKTCINAIGISEWLCRSLRFTNEERIRYIEELKNYGLVPVSFEIQVSRKELDFFSEFQAFIRNVSPTASLKRQVNVCDSYIVDGLLDGWLVIEYDENMHYSYDQIAEKERAETIKSYGYSLVRVNDKMSIGDCIGLVWNKYLSTKDENKI